MFKMPSASCVIVTGGKRPAIATQYTTGLGYFFILYFYRMTRQELIHAVFEQRKDQELMQFLHDLTEDYLIHNLLPHE